VQRLQAEQVEYAIRNGTGYKVAKTLHVHEWLNNENYAAIIMSKPKKNRQTIVKRKFWDDRVVAYILTKPADDEYLRPDAKYLRAVIVRMEDVLDSAESPEKHILTILEEPLEVPDNGLLPPLNV
jgi:hypothetical protein